MWKAGSLNLPTSRIILEYPKLAGSNRNHQVYEITHDTTGAILFLSFLSAWECCLSCNFCQLVSIRSSVKVAINRATVSVKANSLHHPWIEHGAHRWQRWILPLNQWCCNLFLLNGVFFHFVPGETLFRGSFGQVWHLFQLARSNAACYSKIVLFSTSLYWVQTSGLKINSPALYQLS